MGHGGTEVFGGIARIAIVVVILLVLVILIVIVIGFASRSLVREADLSGDGPSKQAEWIRSHLAAGLLGEPWDCD